MPLVLIEARDPAPEGVKLADDEGWGELPGSLCGTEGEALAIIRELQAPGDEWAKKEYRIVPRKKSARQKAREGRKAAQAT